MNIMSSDSTLWSLFLIHEVILVVWRLSSCIFAISLFIYCFRSISVNLLSWSLSEWISFRTIWLLTFKCCKMQDDTGQQHKRWNMAAEREQSASHKDYHSALKSMYFCCHHYANKLMVYFIVNQCTSLILKYKATNLQIQWHVSTSNHLEKIMQLLKHYSFQGWGQLCEWHCHVFSRCRSQYNEKSDIMASLQDKWCRDETENSCELRVQKGIWVRGHVSCMCVKNMVYLWA